VEITILFVSQLQIYLVSQNSSWIILWKQKVGQLVEKYPATNLWKLDETKGKKEIMQWFTGDNTIVISINKEMKNKEIW